jgi:rhombotail lipoprotein
MKFTKPLTLGLLAAALLTATGCGILGNRTQRHASSLAQYLYPRGQDQPDVPGVPTLSLPLRVGVAWVPSPTVSRSEHVHPPLTERQKIDLLNQVVPHFKSYAFVKSVEIIPSQYLTPGGGFDNLNQLRSLFNIDVIALISYDQVQFTSQDALSFTYWTVVGAYLFHGENNDTQTLIDAAVYDIPSRRLLFRAPGTSQIKAGATPINLDAQLHKDSERGFTKASTNMVANLQSQLTDFRVRVKESPEEFKVVHKPGYTGAGATGPVEVLALAALASLVMWSRHQRPL